jgi:predicted PurR-regulated permease PerM
VAVVCFFIFLPYLALLILALSLAVAVEPWYHGLTKFCGGHRGVGALLTMVVIAIVILTPLTFIGLQVFEESKSLYNYISSNQAVVIEIITHKLQAAWPGFNFEPNAYLQQFAGALTSNLTAIFSSTFSTFFQIVLGLVALFFFLRDGDEFLKYLVTASPLDDGYDKKIILKIKEAINRVIRGNLLIGLIQGVLASLGFIIFGVPNPALWGSLVALCSFVPTIGTSLVTVPAIIFLFLTGHNLPALGLAIWVALIVGLVDNLLGPYIIGRGSKIHPLFMLFSIIGGVVLFGPIGILLGPLSISFFFALVEIYHLLVQPKN